MKTFAQRRGAALMMVLVLLALLLVLAVSFAFLMAQQEGTSVASLGGEETRIVTRTGADHAYARLNRGNRLNEFAAWWNTRPQDVDPDFPWWTDPAVDGFDESVIDLQPDFEGASSIFPGLLSPDGSPFKVEDAKRLVMGINVQDESGKVNLNSASPQLIANLLGSATTLSEVQGVGDIYDPVNLTDASFLTTYDEDKNTADSRFGSGLVIIDGYLFSYKSRVGNTLHDVTANAPYQGAEMRFGHWPSGRRIMPGMFVCSPTAYKVAMRRILAPGHNGELALYDNLGEVRDIADMAPWFDYSNAGAMGPWVMDNKIRGWPEGLDPVAYQRLERLATVVAPTERFDGGWFYPHVVIRGDMVTPQNATKQLFAFNYDRQQAFQASYYVPQDPRSPNPAQLDYSKAGIGPGNIVRFRRMDTGETFYGVMAGGNAAFVDGGHTIEAGDPWIVECAERARLNINTAPLEVVEAVFHGIGPRGKDADDLPITRDQARRIATAIKARIHGTGTVAATPFRHLQDVDSFLVQLSQQDESVITRKQIGLFIDAQRYPYSAQAVVTAQFSYASLDTFMVDAFATRYQPTGGVIARRAFREWASVGSDRPQRYRWRDYVRWLDEMRVPQGNIISLFNAGASDETNGHAVGVHELPFVHYQTVERYMRGRLDAPWAGPQRRDILAMATGTNPPENYYSNVTQAAGGFNAGDLEAGMFSFWYRPQWGGLNQNHYIFDAAEQPYSNRMSLLWWGQRQRGYKLAQHNSGLVLRVKDRTLEEGFTELRYELDANTLRQRDWYHLNATWKGTELSHLSLILDGDCVTGNPPVRPVTNHTFRQPNGAWVSRTSTLQQELEDPKIGMKTTEIYVDAADIGAFPPRGVVVIGSEAIEYNGNNGFALLSIYRGPPVPNVPGSARGARGTVAELHPRGSTVTVYGYVSPVQSWTPPGAQATDEMLPRFPFLPATGGNSRSAMGSKGIYRVSKQGSLNPLYYRPVELGPDAGFAGGVGLTGESGDADHLPLADYAGLQERGIVAVCGYGWRGYFPPGTAGIPQAGVSFPDFDGNGTPPAKRQLTIPADLKFEYVVYDRIDPQGLHVLKRFDERFAEKTDRATWWHFLGTYGTVGSPNQLITPATAAGTPGYQTTVNQINFFSDGSCVIPVSIDIDSVAGYHFTAPSFGSLVQLDDEWFFYNRKWDAANAPAEPLTLLFCIQVPPATAPPLPPIPPLIVTSYILPNANQDNRTPQPWSALRGYYGTAVGNHPAAVPVIPTFASTVRTGEQDVVTTINGKNYDKALHRIRRQRTINVGNDNLAGTPDDVCIAGLYEHCATDYQPNATWNASTGVPNDPYNAGNLCKFPTGELPVELPTEWTFAGSDPRAPEATQAAADFDSFEFRTYPKGDFRLLQNMTDAAPAEGGEIQVSLPFPSTVNVVKVNDELIAYRGTATRAGPTFWLTDISRGVLGTERKAHSIGTPMMNMASLRVARLVNGCAPQNNQIAAQRGAELLREYGFVRIVEGANLELAGYQKQPGTSANVALITGQYYDPTQPQALFRGLYGTQAQTFSNRALVFDQPVRFPDYFPGYHLEGKAAFGAGHQKADQGIPGARSPEISYIQGAAAFRNSEFRDFKWRVAWQPHAEQARYQYGLGARLVMRFRGRGAFARTPDWGEVPTNKPGGLYSFEFDFGGPDTEALAQTAFEQTQDFTNGGNQQGIRADGVEWRVYFYFKQNAFRDDLYKATLQFQGASTSVRQLTQVYRHEEKR